MRNSVACCANWQDNVENEVKSTNKYQGDLLGVECYIVQTNKGTQFEGPMIDLIVSFYLVLHIFLD